jgi:hypothetical protein
MVYLLGIVILLDRLIVCEIPLGRLGDIRYHSKRIFVEGVFGLLASNIVYRDFDVKITEVALWLSRRRLFNVVERH